MSRSRGVVEIGVWDYDAHTPNFPSLSEVHASYPRTPFLSSISPRISTTVHPYPIRTLRLYLAVSSFARILPVTLSFSLSLPLQFSPRLYVWDTRAWQRRQRLATRSR